MSIYWNTVVFSQGIYTIYLSKPVLKKSFISKKKKNTSTTDNSTRDMTVKRI